MRATLVSATRSRRRPFRRRHHAIINKSTAAIAAAILAAWAPRAGATTYEWSGAPFSILGKPIPLGLGGNWDLASDNWLPTNNPSAYTTWPNTTDAIADFDVAGGIVTITAQQIIANGLEFNVSGYTIASNGNGTSQDLLLEGTGAAISVASGQSAVISAPVIGDAGSPVTYNGGTLTLSGATDNGNFALTVDSGTLILAKASSSFVHAIGGAGLTINGGLVQISGTGTNQISSGGSVSMSGGTLDLNGKNQSISTLTLGKSSSTASPAVTLNGGVLSVGALNFGGSATRLFSGPPSGIIEDGTTSGGSLEFSGLNPTVSVTGFSNSNNSAAIDVPISLITGTMNFTGTVLDSNGIGPALGLGAASTYTGATAVKDLNLSLNFPNALPTGTALTLATSNLFVNANQTVASLSGDSTSGIAPAGATLTVGDSTSTTFSGRFGGTGSGGINKVGTGTLTFQNTGVVVPLGFLAINGGGVVINGGAFTTVSPGQTGFSGDSSLFLEGANGASLLVEDGATLTTRDSPQLHNGATITLDGAGTTWTNLSSGIAGEPDTIWIGRAGLNNFLTVQNGASVSAKNAMQLGNVALSSNPGAGVATVASGGSVSVLGTLKLDAGSTLSISGGTVSAGDLQSGTPIIFHQLLFDEPAVQLGSTFGSAALTVGADGIDSTFNGTFSGDGGLTKVGNGTLTLGGTHDNVDLGLTVDAGTVVLAKASSHNPNDVHAIGGNLFTHVGLTVNSGTAQLGGTGGDQIFDGANVVINGGTFDINGKTETILGLTLGNAFLANPTVTLNGGTLSLGANLTYAGGGTNGSNGGKSGIIGSGSVAGGSLQFLGANPTISVTSLTSNPTGTDLEVDVPIASTSGMTFSGIVGPVTPIISLGTASTYTGPTTITNAQVTTTVVNTLPTGTALNLSNADAFLDLGASQTAGSLSGAAGSQILLNQHTLTVGGANTATTYSGDINGFPTTGGGVSKTGTSALTLAGGHSSMGFLSIPSGGIVLDGGSLSLASTGQTGFGTVSSLFLEGNAGATLLAKDGATLTTTDSPQLHNGAAVTLDGAGTSWTNNNTAVAGEPNTLWDGRFGLNNSVTVQNSAQLTAKGRLQVGDLNNQTSNPGTGSLNVTTAGSVSVAGTLFVDGGSSVTVNGATLAAGDLQGGTAQQINAVNFATPSIALSNPSATGSALTVGSDNASTIFGGIIKDSTSGPGGLTKVGTGTLELTGNNNYSGGTIINAGTLAAPNDLALGNFFSKLTVNSGATMHYLGAAETNRFIAVNAGGTLTADSTLTMLPESTLTVGSATSPGGVVNVATEPMQLIFSTVINNGTINSDIDINDHSLYEGTGSAGNVRVGNTGIVHPGNSPGTLTSSAAAWGGGGTLQIDFAHATGTAGTDWSFWNITGALSITATPAAPFTIELDNLEQPVAGVNEPIFDTSMAQSWLLASSTGITGFDPANFTLSFPGFTTPVAGTFSVTSNGENVVLNFTPVPEPGGLAAMALAAAGLLSRRRRGINCDPR